MIKLAPPELTFVDIPFGNLPLYSYDLLRVAVVGPHASPTTTVELLAPVRGYLYQRFPNLQAAEQWLLGPPGVARRCVRC